MRFGILFNKIVQTYCEKKYSRDKKNFEIRSWRPRICKILESERSEQFLLTECFFAYSWRFLISNKLLQFLL